MAATASFSHRVRERLSASARPRSQNYPHWRRIAPAHDGPRNASNNNAHEPTSGRSTHYGSGHLNRVFRDIGHIFSSLYPSLAVPFLSRLSPVRDLLLCANHLFVAAMHSAACLRKDDTVDRAKALMQLPYGCSRF